MITEYQTGNDFLAENNAYLDTNPYLSFFFKLDCPLLTDAGKTNYALKCETDGKKLLVLKVEPYNMLLFGEKECVPELLGFLMEGGYERKNYLCATELGNAFMRELQDRYGIRYREALAMDFMEATQETEPTAPEVETANENDLDEIFDCQEHFVTDCGLLDQPNRQHTQKTIDAFRVIRQDGHIVSMAKLICSAQADIKISNVYTRDAYRGKGYARKVVNAVKNEILSNHKIATLNVDRHNPISYHLYSSLGFRRVFSQGEYRLVE